MKVQASIIIEGYQEVDSWEQYLFLKTKFLEELGRPTDDDLFGITSIKITERVIQTTRDSNG